MTVRVPDLTSVGDLPAAAAALYGDAPALKRATAAGGNGLTFVELADLVRAGTGRLSEYSRGDRVLLVCEGRPGWGAALFSILGAGLVAVPLPADVDAATVETISAFSGAVTIVTSERTGALVPESMPSISIDQLFDAEPTSPAVVSRDQTALLAFTSGSTARPRGVELTQGNLLANLESLLAARSAGPGDILLSMLPPAHLFEFMAGLLAPIACGARVVYPGSPLPNRLVDALITDGITHALSVPALVPLLYDEIRSRDDAVLGLRTLMVGGAALAWEWTAKLAGLGVDLDVGYGLTEAAPIVCLGAASEITAGSVGRPLPGVDVRIDDGEVLVRGANVMRGYFRDDEETGRTLGGGWLLTGDLGLIDDAGCLTITGRRKEAMVTASGETIWPEEVEPHYQSDLFEEAAVAPLVGPDGNEVPMLFVVAPPAVGDAEIQRAFNELRAAAPVRLRLSGMIRTDQPLPRTAIGKVRRHLLSERSLE